MARANRGDTLANLLLVDDDAHIREVMRFALEKAGHQVTEAADGAAALALFQRQPFDLVVLDIVMPELDGLELGGYDYLTKPFSPRELSARVAAVLRRGRGSAVPPAALPPELRGKGKP